MSESFHDTNRSLAPEGCLLKGSDWVHTIHPQSLYSRTPHKPHHSVDSPGWGYEGLWVLRGQFGCKSEFGSGPNLWGTGDYGLREV